jgi:hypothetical protein
MVLKMQAPLLESTDSKNNFEDLSGIDATAYENPYEALVDASQGETVSLLSPSLCPRPYQ